MHKLLVSDIVPAIKSVVGSGSVFALAIYFNTQALSFGNEIADVLSFLQNYWLFRYF